ALLLLYTAKKRAEVASSVGTTDDMFYIDSNSGPQELNSALCQELKDTYELVAEAQRVATQEAEERIMRFFDRPVKEDENEAGSEATSVDPPRLSDPDETNTHADSA